MDPFFSALMFMLAAGLGAIVIFFAVECVDNRAPRIPPSAE